MSEIIELARAVEILGGDHVINPEQASHFWKKQRVRDTDIHIPLSRIESCAKANEAGLANWYLTYSYGFSMKQQVVLTAEDRFNFSDRSRQFIDDKKNSGWFLQEFDPQYYLLDFGSSDRTSRLENYSFKDQNEVLKKFPAIKKRAPLHVVSEAVLCIKNCSDVEVLSTWAHVSGVVVENGLVCIGYATKKFGGINIFTAQCDEGARLPLNIGVVFSIGEDYPQS